MTQDTTLLDIQPKYVTLDDLLYGRLFRIPSYQRNYSWEKKHREDLFNDILYTWNNGETKLHFMSTIVGLYREKITISTKAHDVIEIVDGQQRLTTLIILLKAIEKSLNTTKRFEHQIKKELNSLLVKDDSATLLLLQTNHDSSDYFANYIKTGTHSNSDDANTYADTQLLSCIEECEIFVSKWLKSRSSLEDLVSLLKNKLTFVFHGIKDESLVYTVFEVLNSRGLEVPWFDRLKSIFMAIVFESNNENKIELIEQVHNLWTAIYNIIGKRIGSSSESLRFAATLDVIECPSKTLSEEMATDYFRNKCDGNPSEVLEISAFLKTVTEALEKLLSNRRMSSVTKIAQARLVAISILLRSDFTVEERKDLLRRWEKVTFRIYGLFDNDARTAVGDFVRLAWKIRHDDLSSIEILEKLSHIGKDYPIKSAVKMLRDTDRYNHWEENLRYFLYRYEEYLAERKHQVFENEQWNRIWKESPSKSIEHIYPQSRSDAKWIHWIGNLLILPPKLNSSLQDSMPKQKAKSYSETGLLSAFEVSKEILKGKWQKEEIRPRGEKLIKWALTEWSG